jgi:hypothetical protein
MLLSPKFQSGEDSRDEDFSLPDSLERYGHLKKVLLAGRQTSVAVMCNLPGRERCGDRIIRKGFHEYLRIPRRNRT